MFECANCGGRIVKQALVVDGGHQAICALCSSANVITADESILDTETLVQEPEALVFQEPRYEVEEQEEEDVVKFPWLETSPEDQLAEMRREFDLPPEVEIPPPGFNVPTVFPARDLGVGEFPRERNERFYKNNMNRLWSHTWDQMGDILGDEAFEEFTYPILTQFADTPELVEELFTPQGGSRLQGQFLNVVKAHMYQYLLSRGVDLTMGGGRPGEVELDYLKFPELTDYVYEIMFQKQHPDYLGAIPEFMMDPLRPRRSLEIPYIGELVMKVREWEEENP